MGRIEGRLAAVTLGVVVPSVALAAVPYTFTNQGHLVDAAGASIEGSHNLTFAIYGSTGGALWTEPHPSVALQGGYYSVELGGIVPFPEDLFATGPRFLGVTIDSGPELAPRMQLVSVPTARVSQAMEIASSAPFACDQGGPARPDLLRQHPWTGFAGARRPAGRTSGRRPRPS
jgi:hypothetical protein